MLNTILLSAAPFLCFSEIGPAEEPSSINCSFIAVIGNQAFSEEFHRCLSRAPAQKRQRALWRSRIRHTWAQLSAHSADVLKHLFLDPFKNRNTFSIEYPQSIKQCKFICNSFRDHSGIQLHINRSTDINLFSYRRSLAIDFIVI